MIDILEKEFLCDEGFVVKIKEYYLFKWCYKKEELHCYNQRIISEFIAPKEKKTLSIGFKTTTKQPKKKKKEK